MNLNLRNQSRLQIGYSFSSVVDRQSCLTWFSFSGDFCCHSAPVLFPKISCLFFFFFNCVIFVVVVATSCNSEQLSIVNLSFFLRLLMPYLKINSFATAYKSLFYYNPFPHSHPWYICKVEEAILFVPHFENTIL